MYHYFDSLNKFVRGCFIEWCTCSLKTTNIYRLILLNIPVSCLENYKKGAIMLKVAEVGGLEIPNNLRTKLLVHINLKKVSKYELEH